ncbi:MAG: PIG-L family deacetylase [Acidimicrobiia bacterium]|nr:PIG-L family deacetylase [Acidimicrobiia bacterium]
MPFHDLSDPPERALVIVAHPDDIDFGTAGTIARLTKAGTTVSYALVSSGEAGAPEDMPRTEVAALREREQRSAAAEVGVSDVIFLRWPDGRIEPTLELRRDLSRVVRQVRPDLVICQSPEARWDRIYSSHPDHLAVGRATMAVLYPDAQNPHAHPELLAEGLEPHSVPEAWVLGLEPPDVFIDITEVFEAKVAALGSHVSQTADRFEIDELLREWAAGITERHDLPVGRLTEAFRRISTA